MPASLTIGRGHGYLLTDSSFTGMILIIYEGSSAIVAIFVFLPTR